MTEASELKTTELNEVLEFIKGKAGRLDREHLSLRKNGDSFIAEVYSADEPAT